MSSIIAKRYEIVPDIPIASEVCEAFCVTDRNGGPDDLLQLFAVRRAKLSDLIHSMVERQAEELSRLDDPRVVRLLRHGFDGANNLHYFVYQWPTGTHLGKYLATYKPGLDWAVKFLTSVARIIGSLHERKIAHGNLADPDEIYLNPREPDQPTSINQIGLGVLARFIRGEANVDFGELEQADVTDFGRLVASVICQKLQPTEIDEDAALKTVPAETRPMLERLLGRSHEPALKDFTEIRKILDQLRQQLAAKEQYYISITKSAVSKAYDNGLIVRPEEYLAIPFLEKEFRRKVYGWSEESRDGEGRVYLLVTPQMVMVCRPDRNATPPRSITIVDLQVGDQSKVVFHQERALQLDFNLRAVPFREIPKTASIQPLLEAIDAHVDKTLAVRDKDLEHKNYLEIWPRLLEEQWRQLRMFSLRYVDLEVVDNETAVVVTLEEPIERESVPQEEPLRLTNASGRQSSAGYFEDVTGNRLKIGLSAGVDPKGFDTTGEITVDNSQAESIIRRQRDAIKRLRYHESINPNLPRLLFDPTQIEIGNPVNFPFSFVPNLDEKQREAVRKALATQDLFLIQGPPGTGKTTVIAESVLQILERDSRARILVTSQSNVAVNNALDKIVLHRPDMAEYVVRVGREEKAGTAEALLLNRQLEAWRKTIVKKSQDYLTEVEAKVVGSKGLMEALGILAECEAAAKTQSQTADELKATQQALADLDLHYRQLEQTLNRALAMRQEAEATLSKIAPDDQKLRQYLRDFQEQFLQYGIEFLKHADEVSELSLGRSRLMEKSTALEADLQRLANDIAAGTELVNEFLAKEYQFSFPDYVQQRLFLNAKAATKAAQYTRLGQIKRIADEWKVRVSSDTSGFASAYLQRCKVVGATCIGVAAKGEVSEMEFDWVIADESGKALPPELLVPLVRGRKLVLVGDHKQLPPTISRDLQDAMAVQNLERDEVQRSLFQMLIEPAEERVKLELEVQYRMHPAIGKLIGDCFYDRKLAAGVQAEDRAHGFKWCPRPVIWANTKSLANSDEIGKRSYYNQAEIETILRLLDKIEASYDPAKPSEVSVGVITAYSAQKAELRRRIAARRGNWPHLNAKLEVDTVDAYQGRERDIIIYSVVRSNAQGRIGFLSDERRLNVALSRARNLLIIVGNIDTEYARASENPFYSVIQHIRQNPSDCKIVEANEL
jgi:hypothetical protein